MEGEPRRAGGPLRPSDLVLVVVLAAAAIGAISLVRQPPNPRLATPKPPPAWAALGHDAARSGHSLSYPVGLPITQRWWRTLPPIARPPVIDGYGNAYLARSDGALLALDANGNTRWCAAVQPITDTSCTAPLPGGDAALYALDAHGRVRWRLPLAPGRPSYAAIAGAGREWVAWVAVAGGMGSWVIVADERGPALWRWSTVRPVG